MSWSTTGLNLRGPQGPSGTVVDGVSLVDTSFQFTAQGQPVGSPVSFLVLNIDGGSPSSTSAGYIDGGTL